MDEGVAQTGGVKRTYDVISNVEMSCLRRCGPPPPSLYGIVAKSFGSSPRLPGQNVLESEQDSKWEAHRQAISLN